MYLFGYTHLHFIFAFSFHFWSSFCCCSSFVDVLHFVVVFHSYFLFDVLPPFRGLSPGFYTHFILLAKSIAEWFANFSFSTIPLIFLPRALWLLLGIFYPQAFFTLCSITYILTCICQDFPGGLWFFLGVCTASYWSSRLRPGPFVCLLYSNPQSSYSERFSFTFYHILAWIACGESLIYLLFTRFEFFLLVQSHM